MINNELKQLFNILSANSDFDIVDAFKALFLSSKAFMGLSVPDPVTQNEIDRIAKALVAYAAQDDITIEFDRARPLVSKSISSHDFVGFFSSDFVWEAEGRKPEHDRFNLCVWLASILIRMRYCVAEFDRLPLSHAVLFRFIARVLKVIGTGETEEFLRVFEKISLRYYGYLSELQGEFGKSSKIPDGE